MWKLTGIQSSFLQFSVDTSWTILDPIIAVWLLDPDNPVNNFEEVLSKVGMPPMVFLLLYRDYYMVTFIWVTSWENLCMPYANNKGTDQPAHLHSLICTFVVRCLDTGHSCYVDFAYLHTTTYVEVIFHSQLFFSIFLCISTPSMSKTVNVKQRVSRGDFSCPRRILYYICYCLCRSKNRRWHERHIVCFGYVHVLAEVRTSSKQK